jgi:hypothetical protein
MLRNFSPKDTNKMEPKHMNLPVRIFSVFIVSLASLLLLSCADDVLISDCRYEDYSCSEEFECVESNGLWHCIDWFGPSSSGVPYLSLTSPLPNEEVESTLAIRISVQNLLLVPFWNSTHVEGEGHIHLYIDEQPVVPDYEGIVETAFNIYVDQLSEEEPTTHVLHLVTHNNDHTLLSGIEDITLEWIKTPL